MNTNGLIVDVQPIADGIYEMICDAGQEAIVAFGMIPVEFVRLLETQLRTKIIEIEAQRMQVSVADIEPFVVEAQIKKEIGRAHV